MDGKVGELAGRILRTWREHAGKTNAEVARKIHVSKSAVSMWESGIRGERADAIEQVELYAKALDIGMHQSAALKELWQAARSPSVTHPRLTWAHNFEAPAGPVWIWIRPRTITDPLSVVMEWEPFRASIEAPSTDNGVLIQAPTSAPNPPLTISLNQPSWVDFGRGDVPAEVAAGLGFWFVRASEFVGPDMPWGQPGILQSPEREPLFHDIRLAARAAKSIGLQWVFGSRDARQALDGTATEVTTWPGKAITDQRGMVVSQLLASPRQAQELREARGLSRKAAAGAASDLDPTNPITQKMIEALEGSESRIPDVPLLLSRLDMIYKMDGRFGIDRVFDSVTQSGGGLEPIFKIDFPKRWRGPTWVQARHPDPAATCTIELTWGPWRRKQRTSSGGVLTTRKATTDAPPLSVRVPKGWSVVAGVGALPTALDVNRGWYPHDIAAAILAIREGIRAVKDGIAAGREGSPKTTNIGQSDLLH